ncbi:MAG: hypothetical protein FWD06_03660 [Oscillospiraceae bacterium]|nr:hypothetical protein [Oscillospiraceae bacterium]
MNFKRVCVLLIISALCVATAIPAAGLSGFVGGARWNDIPAIPIIQSTQGSLNSISRASVSVILNPAQTLVTLGFSVHAPAVTQTSPVGAILLLGSQEIGRWQHGHNAIYDQENYALRGAAWIPDDTSANHYNIVLELGSKHAAAFDALQQLRLQLIDPQSRPSLSIDFPIIIEQPEPPQTQTQTQTQPQTQAQTAPSTTQTTTTATTTSTTAATTTTTTTRTTATTTTTTTRATTTTAPPLTFAAQPTAAPTQFVLPTLPPALLAAAPALTTAQLQQTQADQFFTVTTWHTVIIENITEPALVDEPQAAQLTFAQPDYTPAALSIIESVICPQMQFVQDEPIELVSITLAQATSAAESNAWLLATGAGLLVLALVLVLYWLNVRKAAAKEKTNDVSA